MTTTNHAIAFVALTLGGTLVAQSDWQLHGGAAPVRLVGPETVTLDGPRAQRQQLPAGDWRVHFGVDALGQPGALAFVVPDAARVRLATERAGAVVSHALDPNGVGWTELAGPDTVRTTGAPDAGDYRIAATVDGDASCGLVARFRSANEFYALLVDATRREVRLERRLGDKPLVLATAPLPTAAGKTRALALQVHGFRLHAFLDGESVLQVFDGAIQRGAYGVCWRGKAPTFASVVVSPPASPRASCAAVADGSTAIALHASTPMSPGHAWFVELALDRPHPLVPLDANGIEPWLLQPPAAPQAMLCDWKGSLGAAALGEVPSDGKVTARLQWPDRPGVRRLGAMARFVFVTSDGAAVGGVSPAVRVEFQANRSR